MAGVFPEDYYSLDSGSIRKYFDLFVEDASKAYGQDYRHYTAGLKYKPGARVIVCGAGASANVAMLMQTYLHDSGIILEVVQDYTIPGKLKADDLVIFLSNTGNSEEPIACFKESRRIPTQGIAIASGGRMEEAVKVSRANMIKIPKGYPSRCATATLFFTLLRVLEDAGVIESRRKDVDELLSFLGKQKFDSFAISLSESLYGKIPVIYSSKPFFSVAERLKTMINQSAKSVAFVNALPDINYDELEGFDHKNGIYHAVLITTDEDNSRLRKRLSVTKEVLRESDVPLTELHLKGSRLIKIFTAVIAGDLTAYYLALRYKADPSSTPVVDKIRKDMGPMI